MKKTVSLILILSFSVLFVGCAPEVPDRFGYGYRPLARDGKPDFVVYVTGAVKFTKTIEFDETTSNLDALKSLRNLKENVLFANADGEGLVIMGTLDEKTQKFTIDDWYIKTPFRSRKFVESADGETRSITMVRYELNEDDFYGKVDFDPKQHTMAASEHDRSRYGGDEMRSLIVHDADEALKE